MGSYEKSDLQRHYRIAREIVERRTGTILSSEGVTVGVNSTSGVVEIDFPQDPDDFIVSELAESLPGDAYVIRSHSKWVHRAV